MWRRRDPAPGLPTGLGPVALPVPPGMPWLAEAVRLVEAGDSAIEAGEHARVPGERAPAAVRALRLLRAAVWLDRCQPLDVAWCGLFVRHCLTTAYPRTRPPWLSMRARPWLGYGRPCAPQVGALAVFWLWHPRSPFGHTGFIWAEDAEAWHVIGGNQRNRVRIQRVGRTRLLGTRWPQEAWPPPGLRRHAHPGLAAPYEFGEETELPDRDPHAPEPRRP